MIVTFYTISTCVIKIIELGILHSFANLSSVKLFTLIFKVFRKIFLLFVTFGICFTSLRITFVSYMSLFGVFIKNNPVKFIISKSSALCVYFWKNVNLKKVTIIFDDQIFLFQMKIEDMNVLIW